MDTPGPPPNPPGPPPGPQPEPTRDGSWTLRSARHGATYHSLHGALTEARHVFVDHGLVAWHAAAEARAQPARPCDVLEVGWGTGLNAACIEQRALAEGWQVRYRALETDPLPLEATQALDYGTATGLGAPTYRAMMSLPPDTLWSPGPHFEFCWEHRDVRHWSTPDASLDLILYDAFAPETQPELWTPDVFAPLYRALRWHGLLVTYCAKGDVRRALRAAGFATERLPGPPGKREMLAARKTPLDRFNLRVYGLVIHDQHLLVARERIHGQWHAKLPGGGVQPGEGIEPALLREFQEELGAATQFAQTAHFYTTGFFQRSAFHPTDQIVSIYYRVTLLSPLPAEGTQAADGSPQSFHWRSLTDLHPDDLSFPIDRHVLSLLLQSPAP